MVVSEETVVFRAKLTPVSPANSRLPPDKVRVPLPRAPVLVMARKVPADTAVPPVCKLAPERASVPAPALVKEPEVLVEAPDIVSVWPAVETSMVLAVEAVRTKLRSVLAVLPVY